MELIGTPNAVGSVGRGSPAITYAYQFDNADVACHGEGRIGLLTAWLRSPAQFETTFAMEAFMDEMAAASGQDPLAFRIKHLQDPRAIDVLQAAAKAYGWESRPFRGKPVQSGGQPVHGRGVAWANRDGVRVATIADVTVDPQSGQIKVTRVVVAHDCGLAVNPDGLRLNFAEGVSRAGLNRSAHPVPHVEDMTTTICVLWTSLRKARALSRDSA